MSVLTNNVVICNKNQYPLILERRKKDIIPFFEDTWTSYVERYYFIQQNGNEINITDDFMTIYEANILLTICDYISKNKINSYKVNAKKLRPQMTYNIEKSAIKELNKFFEDTSQFISCYGNSSAGYTSHCAIRINDVCYNAYISISNGPYIVEIIDKEFISKQIEFNIDNIIDNDIN